VKRREFITLLGGTAAASWPLRARAQHSGRIRRVGVLQTLASDNPQASTRLTAFAQGLQALNWTEGANLHLEVRWSGSTKERTRDDAAELVSLQPDVLLAIGTAALERLHQASRTIPIVFTLVSDPVGGGFVESLARPGGNITGFTLFEYSMGGKWLGLLKQIAPQVKRAAILRDATLPSGVGYFTAIQSLAPQIGIDVRAINVSDPREIEAAIRSLAESPNGGLIVAPAPVTITNSGLIIALAAQYKLPAVYWDRFYVAGGGLVSYGADSINQCRLAATYVDRILKGEAPADLPVQAATKLELAINSATAKALGLDIPPMVLALADEVIE
jgi:putative tryptophan/tyrosine transport system substrate-binding protein